MIDLTLHSVAVVIPAGWGAKVLKGLIDLFLWLTKPPVRKTARRASESRNKL